MDGRKVRRSKFLPLALGGAVAAFALCANYSAARAGDDDVQDESATDKFLHTFGLKAPDDKDYDINYSERSPLVVPPNRNLPPPVAAVPPQTPNWPKDPDIAKRQATKQAEKPTPHNDLYLEDRRVLRPDELNVGANTKVATPGTPEQSPPPPGAKKSIFSLDWLNPNKEVYTVFTGERTRTTLTDPPAGYLTPSPDQPYGIGPEKAAPPHVKSVAERMEPVTGH